MSNFIGMRIPNILKLFACLMTCVALCSCSDGVSRTEVWRKSSPNGNLEAVLTSSDAGATTDVVYALYIVPKGGSTSSDSIVVDVDQMSEPRDLRVEWLAEDLLSVHSDYIRVFFKRPEILISKETRVRIEFDCANCKNGY